MPATRRRSENAHEASRSPIHVISPLLTRSNQGVADAGAVESLLIRGAYAVRVFDSSQCFGLPVFPTVAASSGQRSNLSFDRGGNLTFGLISKDASDRGVRAACSHTHRAGILPCTGRLQNLGAKRHPPDSRHPAAPFAGPEKDVLGCVLCGPEIENPVFHY